MASFPLSIIQIQIAQKARLPESVPPVYAVGKTPHRVQQKCERCGFSLTNHEIWRYATRPNFQQVVVEKICDDCRHNDRVLADVEATRAPDVKPLVRKNKKQ